jgi:hypothetical protein
MTVIRLELKMMMEMVMMMELVELVMMIGKVFQYEMGNWMMMTPEMTKVIQMVQMMKMVL